jgi:hypothetical protein
MTFLMDLRREELLVVLDWRFILRGRRYQPPGLQNLTRDDLLRYGKALFVRGVIPRGFQAEDTSLDLSIDGIEQIAEEADEGQPEAETASNVEPDEADVAANKDEDEDDRDTETTDGGAAGITGDWSSTKKITEVLRMVGLDEGQRLRTSKFREMLSLLEESGMEVRLSDGTHLDLEDESPGINAEVQVRRLPTASAVHDGPGLGGTPIQENAWLGAVAFPLVGTHANLALVRARLSAMSTSSPFVSKQIGLEGTFEEAHLAVCALCEASYPDVSLGASLDVEVTDLELLTDSPFGLATALAMFSARTRQALIGRVAVIGNVDVNGKVLPVTKLNERLAAVKESGYTQVILPTGNLDSSGVELDIGDLELFPVESLADAITYAIPSATVETTVASEVHS